MARAAAPASRNSNAPIRHRSRAACEVSRPWRSFPRASADPDRPATESSLRSIRDGGLKSGRLAPPRRGQIPHLAAPPVAIATTHRVCLAGCVSDWTRTINTLGSDLEARALDPQFPPLTLSASKPAAGGVGTVNSCRLTHTRAPPSLTRACPDASSAWSTRRMATCAICSPFTLDLRIDLDDGGIQGATAAVTSSLVTTADITVAPRMETARAR